MAKLDVKGYDTGVAVIDLVALKPEKNNFEHQHHHLHPPENIQRREETNGVAQPYHAQRHHHRAMERGQQPQFFSKGTNGACRTSCTCAIARVPLQRKSARGTNTCPGRRAPNPCPCPCPCQCYRHPTKQSIIPLGALNLEALPKDMTVEQLVQTRKAASTPFIRANGAPILCLMPPPPPPTPGGSEEGGKMTNAAIAKLTATANQQIPQAPPDIDVVMDGGGNGVDYGESVPDPWFLLSPPRPAPCLLHKHVHPVCPRYL